MKFSKEENYSNRQFIYKKFNLILDVTSKVKKVVNGLYHKLNCDKFQLSLSTDEIWELNGDIRYLKNINLY